MYLLLVEPGSEERFQAYAKPDRYACARLARRRRGRDGGRTGRLDTCRPSSPSSLPADCQSRCEPHRLHLEVPESHGAEPTRLMRCGAARSSTSTRDRPGRRSTPSTLTPACGSVRPMPSASRATSQRLKRSCQFFVNSRAGSIVTRPMAVVSSTWVAGRACWSRRWTQPGGQSPAWRCRRGLRSLGGTNSGRTSSPRSSLMRNSKPGPSTSSCSSTCSTTWRIHGGSCSALARCFAKGGFWSSRTSYEYRELLCALLRSRLSVDQPDALHIFRSPNCPPSC